MSGGWCVSSGKSMPKGVKNIERVELGGGRYQINTLFSNGYQVQSVFDSNGNLMGSGDVAPFNEQLSMALV